MDSDEENSSSMERIIKARLYEITQRINKHKAEAEAYCKKGSDDRETVQQAHMCALKLENMIKRFTTELNEYFRISTVPSADEISEMSNAQLNGEEILVELKCKLEKNKTEYRESDGQTRNFSAKLPTLTLPEFNGDVLAWSEFWDIYKSNIHDRSIPDVDKLLYLKSILKGEPRKIVDGLETTNKNYTIAIQILKDRYGKQSQIIDAHYSALSKVKTADKTISECRIVLNELERHLRVLQSHGENTNHNHLRHLILEKFPEDVVYEMKMKMKEDTVEEMRKQLEIIISAREEANRIQQEKNGTERETFTVETLHTTFNKRKYINKSLRKENNLEGEHYKKEETRKGYKNRKQSPPSHFRNRQDMTRKRKHDQIDNRSKERKVQTERREVIDKKRIRSSCVFCDKDHFADQCQEYKTIKQRKSKLKNNCFNCLRTGHLVHSCKLKRRCFYCHTVGNHHRSLCPKQFQIETDSFTTVK